MTGTQPREPALRIFACELNASVLDCKQEGDEKKPAPLMSPLGVRYSRILIAGTLTEKVRTGTDTEPGWRARIQDVNGIYYVSIGKFQEEALEEMEDLEPPCFVAAVGRARLYQPEGQRPLVSVRPDRILEIDEQTLDEWLCDAADSTWHRLKWMRKVLHSPGAELPQLIEMGMTPEHARDVLKSLEMYEAAPDAVEPLKSIQNALRRILPDEEIDFGYPEKVEAEKKDEDPEGLSETEEIVLKMLEELDVDGRGAPRVELEKRAEAEGIDATKLEETTTALLDKGQIYEPNLRYLKLI